MKAADKKRLAIIPVVKPEHSPDKKQTSGDQLFDNAIDRLFPKKQIQAPAK